jgi:hypothetical protein
MGKGMFRLGFALPLCPSKDGRHESRDFSPNATICATVALLQG